MINHTRNIIRLLAVAGCLLGLAHSIHASTYPPKGWVTNVFDAVKEAETSNKNIFIKFTGSDWCGFCKQLDAKVLKHKAFMDYAKDNLVLLYVDFPMNVDLDDWQALHNEYLKEIFGVQGYPQVVVLKPDLQLALITGYRDNTPEQYIKHLQEDNLSETISTEENKEIAAELTELFKVVKEELDKVGKS